MTLESWRKRRNEGSKFQTGKEKNVSENRMIFNHKLQKETSDPKLLTITLKSLSPSLQLVLYIIYTILLKSHIPFFLGLSFYVSFSYADKHKGGKGSC